jgi:hypothetical protein
MAKIHKEQTDFFQIEPDAKPPVWGGREAFIS